MPDLFLILVAVVTILALLILFGGPSPPSTDRPPRIPSSMTLLTEPDRSPLPHEWKYKYVPIVKTTLSTRDGKTWVRHREDIPLLSPSSSAHPKDLRQHRIIFN